MEQQGRPGGIVAAATVTVEHRGLVEYELMTRTGYTLDDLGGRLSWPALFSFIRYLPPGALDEDSRVRAWSRGELTAPLLADIFDVLAAYVTRGKAKPYPRPTDKYNPDKHRTRHVGADAIPIRDFETWWNQQEG